MRFDHKTKGFSSFIYQSLCMWKALIKFVYL